ncbi:MAG: THUMP domain-containing class I SAM-dependent RNA methyltransferase [Calditrichia bacterium]
MFLYQKNGQYFAQVAGGMEELGSEELGELGATGIRAAYRGIYFSASKEVLYRIVYNSRLLSRVLAPISTFPCASDEQLYKRGKLIPWETLLKKDETFAIFATTANSKMTHSHFAALRLKDAVVDRYRERSGGRPSVQKIDPDLQINLRIENDRGIVSVDVSGGAMHRRGYRVKSVEAPIQETVAAAIIRMSGWTGETPLYDPFCGSGTLLCEALMSWANVPSGYLRKDFGVGLLPDFDAGLWDKMKVTSAEKIRSLPKGLLAGSDISEDAVYASRANCARLPDGKAIDLSVASYESLPDFENTTIVCNPPYGLRLNSCDDMRLFYKTFGDFLKRHCTGCTAWVYFGDRKLIGSLGLRPSRKIPLVNGSLDGRLTKIELY